MRRSQNADTHAHKQHWLSQNIFPVCSSFVLVIASDIHLEPESEKRAERKTLIFTQLKISRYKQHLFVIFRRLLYCSPTCDSLLHQRIKYYSGFRTSSQAFHQTLGWPVQCSYDGLWIQISNESSLFHLIQANASCCRWTCPLLTLNYLLGIKHFFAPSLGPLLNWACDENMAADVRVFRAE